MNGSGKSAVVIGAGVAGLATAIGLRQDGWHVEVLERADRVHVLGTALGIWPQAQEALERLGLGPAVHQHATVGSEGLLRRRDGAVLAAIPTSAVERRGGRPLVLVSRSDLLALMLDALPDGVVRTGRAVSTLADLPADADLVVAADGIGSTVRTMVTGERTRPVDTGLVAFRGIVTGEFAPYGEVWGDGAIFGVTPLRPGYTNWYTAWRMPAGHRRGGGLDGGLDSGTDWSHVRRALAHWAHPVPAVVEAAEPARMLRHPVLDLKPALRTSVVGRVVIVGDAAHAMLPHVGQGACQAILDAEALTRSLREGADVKGALARFDRERRRPAQRVASAARVLARVAHATTATPARDRLLRLAGSAAASSPVAAR